MIRSVALVYHFQQFKHVHHRKLNVFAVQHKLECVEEVLSPVSATSNKTLSDGIHVACTNYEIIPVLMLRTCNQIASLVAAMLCRVAQSQLPTNLFRVFVHPGVWKMMKDDGKHNYHSTTHPFYIDQVEVSIKKKTIHFADWVLHLVTELLDPSPSHYIYHLKGYTREHVQYFQAHVLGCMFGVGARCPHPPTDDYNGAHVGQKKLPNGTHLNVLTHLPSENAYGDVMSQFVRQGLDGFTLLFEGGP
jgi:hypothetical protein